MSDATTTGPDWRALVIQHERPRDMTRALMSVVHEGTSAGDALASLRG